tara:strand:+ start:737 stop:1009 length:273 start_codon:yes stop_codon:yes gene_type:complete
MTSDYPELRRVGKLIYEAWEDRPDAPKWAKGNPVGLAVELAEEFVDLQFQVALAISQGQTTGKDQYGRVERDRVESLGTKFIYSPGGFQV